MKFACFWLHDIVRGLTGCWCIIMLHLPSQQIFEWQFAFAFLADLTLLYNLQWNKEWLMMCDRLECAEGNFIQKFSMKCEIVAQFVFSFSRLLFKTLFSFSVFHIASSFFFLSSSTRIGNTFLALKITKHNWNNNEVTRVEQCETKRTKKWFICLEKIKWKTTNIWNKIE